MRDRGIGDDPQPGSGTSHGRFGVTGAERLEPDPALCRVAPSDIVASIFHIFMWFKIRVFVSGFLCLLVVFCTLLWFHVVSCGFMWLIVVLDHRKILYCGF